MNRDECNLMGCEGVFNCIVPEDERPQKCRDWKVVCLKRLEEVTCQK